MEEENTDQKSTEKIIKDPNDNMPDVFMIDFKRFIFSVMFVLSLIVLCGIALEVLFPDKSYLSENYVIGDVVELSDVPEPIMIVGYCQEHSVTGEVYDYVGVSYPDGYLGSDYNYLFNDEDITHKYGKYSRKDLYERKTEIQSWSVTNDE